MSDADALEIIAERRSNMYDPLVVDTFFKIYGALRANEAKALQDDSGAAGSDTDPLGPETVKHVEHARS
jgi:hypothetical protein